MSFEDATPANAVRSAFIAKGTAMTAWCRSNGVNISRASACLSFRSDGVKARELRQRIARAAGVPASKVMSDDERAYFDAARA